MRLLILGAGSATGKWKKANVTYRQRGTLVYTVLNGDCPTVRKQIGKTTYIVRVHFSQTAKETMEDKIKRLLREEVRKM